MRTALKRRMARIEAAQAALSAWEQVDHARADIDVKGVFRCLYAAGAWVLEDVLRDTLHLSGDDIACQIEQTARDYEAWLLSDCPDLETCEDAPTADQELG